LTRADYDRERYEAIKADPVRYRAYLKAKSRHVKKWNNSHPEYHRRKNAQKRKILQQWVRDYFAVHPCVDCGESDPIVLEFDHVRGSKVADICQLVQHRTALAKIVIEVGKCEVRCANCHRRATYNRRRREA
jgi:hypothetical protein